MADTCSLWRGQGAGSFPTRSSTGAGAAYRLAYLLPNLRGELRTCTLSGLSSSAWLLALSQSLSRRAPEPQGFILTTILGIVGAFVATYLGQAIGWYGPDQGAGLIGAIVGAVLILLVWGFIDRRRSA